MWKSRIMRQAATACGGDGESHERARTPSIRWSPQQLRAHFRKPAAQVPRRNQNGRLHRFIRRCFSFYVRRHRRCDESRVESRMQDQCKGGEIMDKRVLDPCCGSRMMWFDRNNPDVVFGDKRSETIVVTDRSHGNSGGTRTLRIEPDTMIDFRALPYPDGAFKLVVFDPPHLVRAGKNSWLAAKYGRLSENWRDDLREGLSECFRVLDADGTLIFKWNETQVRLRDILSLTPIIPLFGQKSGHKGMTHWLVFMKPKNCKSS